VPYLTSVPQIRQVARQHYVHYINLLTHGLTLRKICNREVVIINYKLVAALLCLC